MKRFLIWLGWKPRRVADPEKILQAVAEWRKVPEEALEDLPNFVNDVNRFVEAYHYPKELFKVCDPDIETDKKY